MRLPFPQRIPLPIAFVAATILAGLQQLQQTSIVFTLYCFLFIVIATVAFNYAGGFTQTAGSYVFFYSVLGLIVGVVYKAYLGEPGDSNLRSPIITVQVFTGGIFGMLLAVVISRKITRKRAFLGNILRPRDVRNAAIGCFTFGLFLNVLTAVLPHENGSLLSALSQLNRFLAMSVILSTIYTIRKSNGRRSVGLLVMVSTLATSGFGLLSFSKEALFTPFLCWLVAACSLRFRIRWYQIGVGAGVVYFMFHFLVPYSQFGRNAVPPEATFGDRIVISGRLLSDLGGLREQYSTSIEEADREKGMGYYDEPQGFFDRLSMIKPDDALIDYASQGHYSGISDIVADFANWIPHVLWPNKPIRGAGNILARQIGGIVGEDDTSTGISFTPSGDAFQMAGWTGLLVLAPMVWILLFTVFDSICGDTRNSPWGLLAIALFAHTAPEGMLAGSIYIVWYGAIGIVFVAVATAYAMPLIGTLLAGPEHTGLVRLRRNPRAIGLPPARPLNPSNSST